MVRVGMAALILLTAALPAAAQGYSDYDDFSYRRERTDPGALALGCLCSLGVGALFGWVGYSTGKNKGLGTAGFFLGFFLGIIGIIIVSFMQGNPTPILRRRSLHRPIPGRGRSAPPAPASAKGLVPCPYCAELIQPAARICRFCKSALR